MANVSGKDNISTRGWRPIGGIDILKSAVQGTMPSKTGPPKKVQETKQPDIKQEIKAQQTASQPIRRLFL